MKVGNYVRTKEGYITKIDSCTCWEAEKQWYISYTLPNGCECASTVNDRFKISSNIIDLIEVGDYVNGSKVACIVEEDGYKYLILDRDEVYYDDDDSYEISDSIYIKSIVTKEQFSQMEYKL